jgi:predicted  nucleic acid-binding Zn-ribbon protein
MRTCEQCGHSMKMVQYANETSKRLTCPDCGWRKSVEMKREQLIRNARRCMADLCGGHVWKWSVGRLRCEAYYVLRERSDELASDEQATLRVLSNEFEERERVCQAILARTAR